MAASTGVFLVVSAAAADKPTMNFTSMRTPSVTNTEGILTAIDPASGWIKVKELSGREWTLDLNGRSGTVWRNGKKVPWLELKSGEKVLVRHVKKVSKDVVKTIEIRQPGQAAS